ncbi:MAG: lysophospholipid acyltransferase family protein [Armatimonadetes bacterium]|nr:lysophospholipid acyltransferase family protein [Armatimonadota bacterium]
MKQTLNGGSRVVKWLVNAVVLGGIRLILKALGGYRRILEHDPPRTGALIVAPNHVSHADPALVAVTIPRRCRYLATDELFAIPFLGRLCTAMGAFPIKQDSADLGAMRRALAVLKAGEALVAFPEGHESVDGTLQVLQGGVLMLAQRSGCAILPVGIAGTDSVVPPRTFRFVRTSAKLVIVYGEAIPWDQLSGGQSGRPGLEAARRRLTDEIVRLTTRARELRAHSKGFHLGG